MYSHIREKIAEKDVLELATVPGLIAKNVKYYGWLRAHWCGHFFGDIEFNETSKNFCHPKFH